jgi:hypothetical protein
MHCGKALAFSVLATALLCCAPLGSAQVAVNIGVAQLRLILARWKEPSSAGMRIVVCPSIAYRAEGVRRFTPTRLNWMNG